MTDNKSIDSEHLLLRTALRQHRQSLSQEQQDIAAERLYESILADPDYQAASKLAFYLAFDGEISPWHILQHASQHGKTCYLPVLDQQEPVLRFVEYQPQSGLHSNRYGINEPLFDADKTIAVRQLDIIFVPLVAFDRQGTRLGMGKGYYDRTLAELLHTTSTGKPLLLGLAHECQRVEKLERADWDVPLDRIVTDQAVYVARA